MLSLIDQALLSGLNLAVGIVLIRYASKETYGFYTLLAAAAVLSTTLIEALIGAALTTIATQMEQGERSAIVSRVARLQWASAAMVAVLFGIGSGFSAHAFALPDSPYLIGISFFVFIASLGIREFCRTALFIDSRTASVTKLDALYVLLTMSAAGILLFTSQPVTVSKIMLIFASANFISAIPQSTRLWRQSHDFGLADYRADIKMLWRLSQWAFVGAFVGWIGNNIYLYFAGTFLGIEASAELNASRLMMIPVALLGVAWARVARPAVGSMLARHEWEKLDRFAWRSFLSLGGITIAFTSLLIIALPWIESSVLGEKYRQASHLVPLWGLYFLLNALRTVGTTLLTCFGAFKALFWQGMGSLTILMVSCAALMPVWGVKGALSAMIAVEVTELVVNLVFLLPNSKKTLQLLSKPLPTEQ